LDNGARNYRRFLEGDDDGLVEIVREYKDGLMLFLNTYVRNITVAEDLAEDTFVRLVTKKPSFRGTSSFRTWLYAKVVIIYKHCTTFKYIRVALAHEVNRCL
jgi:DNA-directed RNA polymerase specialized sigma24 family protein